MTYYLMPNCCYYLLASEWPDYELHLHTDYVHVFYYSYDMFD